MKKITLFLGILMFALCWQIQAQTQSKSWYMSGKKIDFSNTSPNMVVFNQSISNMFGVYPEQVSPTNAYTDASGNALVTVVGRKVYNANGVLVDAFSPYSYLGFDDITTSEVSIVPVPGSSCKYYIIYSFYINNGVDNFCDGHPEQMLIAQYQQIYYAIYDASGNSGTGALSVSVPLIECKAHYPHVITQAVSHIKPGNVRYLYLTSERPNVGITIMKYTISDIGITISSSDIFQTNTTTGNMVGVESDLSFDDSKLIFTNAQEHVYWAHLNPVNGNLQTSAGNLTNGLTRFIIPGDVQAKGVEFSPDGSKAFVGVKNTGILQIGVAAVSNLGYVTNSTDYGNSQLEIGYSPSSNYKLYAVSNSGDLGSVNNPNSTGLSMNPLILTAINSGWVGNYSPMRALPDQLDGEFYGNVSISGVLTSCNLTTLTATSGFDNYEWSNGATTQSITVSVSGTYTVTASDNGGCEQSASVNVVIYPNPPITLDTVYNVCNGVFPLLCVPHSEEYKINFKWYFTPYSKPIPHTPSQVFLVSNSPCFTPSAYGNYTVVTTNQYGCTQTHTFSVLPGAGPVLNLQDVYFCGKSPLIIGSPSYIDVVAYNWTFNGIPIEEKGPQIHNKGEGTYCLTVVTKDGCTSSDCFEVKECCEPKTDFSVTRSGSGSTATISVVAGNTQYYESETWILYKYCGNSTDLNSVTWIQVGSPVVRTSNFNTAVPFPGLNPNCKYKIEHRVTVACFKKTYISINYYLPIDALIYGNPLVNGKPLTIEMRSESERAQVEISRIRDGKPIFSGTLEHGKPLVIPYETFDRAGKAGMEEYTIQISNSTETINEKLIVD